MEAKTLDGEDEEAHSIVDQSNRLFSSSDPKKMQRVPPCASTVRDGKNLQRGSQG